MYFFGEDKSITKTLTTYPNNDLLQIRIEQSMNKNHIRVMNLLQEKLVPTDMATIYLNLNVAKVTSFTIP